MTEKQKIIAALLALNTPFRKIQKEARATPQEINQVKRLLTQHTPMEYQITGTIEAKPETDAQVQLPLEQDVTPLQPVPMTATQETITAQERSLMLLEFLQEIIPDTHAASVSLGIAKTWLLAEPLDA
jgi:hypothetical protein